MRQFDYIVVGAGSAGCALAARLTEDPSVSVLLLEAGGSGWHPWVKIPLGYGRVFYDQRFNWKYTTEPEAGLGGRAMYWPRGKVLGGSSAINAMVYVRGHPEDYNSWNAPGWHWDDVAPIFRRMEAWQGEPSQGRGSTGPLTVTDMRKAVHPLTDAYLEAAEQAGFPFNPDYNDTSMNGASTYQITTRHGRRACASRAYLYPAWDRPNLTIATGAQVQRVNFEGRRAVSVSYKQGRHAVTARAGREIILSAGAINTPQILQLSGVGPGHVLHAAGIDVVHDQPQVGRNLMDHLGIDLMFETKIPSMNQILRPFRGKLRAALTYAWKRSGPLAMSLNQGGGFVRFDGQDGPPDLQLYFSPLTYKRAAPGTRPLLTPDPFAAVRLGFSPCKSMSAGCVTITSPDPAAAPKLAAHYMMTVEDQDIMVKGTRLMREIAAQPALADVIKREIDPGPDVQSDEALAENARRDSWTVFHQSGTCRMGRTPETSVVDARLRVHGLEGLRIADASIFPTIPSGNTNAPAIMVGEKAAEILRQDARRLEAAA